MPKEYELTKNQLWGLQLLQGFSDAVSKDQLPDFLKSDELERFLHEGAGESFGDKVPDGTPGSKFPRTSGKDPLDGVHGLFHGIGSDLGKIDHPGGVDPAAAPDGVETRPDGTRVTIHTNPDGDRVTIITRPNGDIGIWTAHTDGSADGLGLCSDGAVAMVHVDQTPNHSTNFGAGVSGNGADSVEVDMYPGANTRDFITLTFHNRDGAPDDHPTRSVWHREQSPGEDGGGEANTGRNALSGIEAVGPQSMQQMLNQMKHPGKDSDEVDPNTGASALKFSKTDTERLGRMAPALDVLDPNSGIDPLTQLNLNPSQMHTRSEDDELDPNSGRKGLDKKA